VRTVALRLFKKITMFGYARIVGSPGISRENSMERCQRNTVSGMCPIPPKDFIGNLSKQGHLFGRGIPWDLLRRN
jgi:hypothetical protein